LAGAIESADQSRNEPRQQDVAVSSERESRTLQGNEQEHHEVLDQRGGLKSENCADRNGTDTGCD
jgi:hypothetical protein